MSRDERASTPQAGHVCPACHEPVTAQITRHKTMGVFIPQWKSGPCHNPTCMKYVPDAQHPSAGGEKR
ncbi:hypothetical protein ACF09E_12580 [Streptomyces sp. NPDC014891]|uniref:hypothetical protein n=1 Tax=Streptomyces sp. NPDC014891 TaxID=3364929 RepID=UPI0036FB94DA